jgi:chromosome segregation ATPase
MLLEAGNLPEKKTALENELITVQAQMNKLRNQEKELTHAVDTATVQLERNHSPADDRAELEQLWASQARVKQESRERHQTLLDAGIAPHELAEVAKSPIDEALARKGRRSIPRLFALPDAPKSTPDEPPAKLSLENQLRFPGNPWLKAHWNITEQMKVMRADAKKAERMAAAAGVDVNAVRPLG